MSKRSSKKKKTGFFINLKDERWPKIGGVICWFLGIYLSIAFISYLYTWKVDQDKVLKFSWQVVLQSDLSMENWLGRLGAIISNAFFYWGFGLPSILIVVLLFKLGFDLLTNRKLNSFWKLTKYSIALCVFFSISLEFTLNNADFSWGGAFGESTSYWLVNFMGRIGLMLLLFFLVIGTTMWYASPFVHELSPALAGIKLPVPAILEKYSQQIASFIRVKSSPSQEPVSAADNELFDVLSDDTTDFNFATTSPELSVDDQEDPDDTYDLDLPENQQKSTQKHSTELEITEKSEHPEVIDHSILSLTQDDSDHKGLDEAYDPYLELSSYKFPNLELLEDYSEYKVHIDREELEANKNQIVQTLLHYNIKIVKIRATIGPTVTLYEIVPASGIRISKIKNLEDDIALSLAALGIRIIAPIPGKGTIGIEVPNKNSQIVSLKEVLNSSKFQSAKMELPLALGKTISNEVFVADLAKMPHLLIAGATGQGKSVGINAVLMSLLYKKHPSELKLILVDPKRVELPIYNDIINHYLAKLPDEEEAIITDTTKVVYTLNSLCIEMDERYELLQKARVRNIKEYNAKFKARNLNPNNGHKYLPFIILVIDEFADLIMTAGKEIELPIGRLAQLARAVGIHLIIATQRPSVKIITGLIKANFPARLAFKVTSIVDSKTILDTKGADQLIGRGDMLLSVGGSNMIRLQCAFVDTPEVERVISFIGDQRGYSTPYYLPEYKGEDDISAHGNKLTWADLDPMFEEAASLIVSNQQGSTSMIQRKLSIGYNRAGRIMDQMEQLGIVGAAQGSKPREVLIFNEMELSSYLDSIRS